MPITKEELERRQGINIGFFYLRTKGAEFGEKKCKVCVKDGQVRVWDGAKWCGYDEFEPSEIVSEAIERCQEFNGKL